jgi:hypothetical protein
MIVSFFSTLSNHLQRWGEDKATEGLLGAMGLGKKSSYSLKFRLACRILSTYIFCQLPIDVSQNIMPRLTSDAPGYVRNAIPEASSGTINATKQADQALAGLEALLTNKSFVTFVEFIGNSLEFIKNYQNTLLNARELLLNLLANLYYDEKSLYTLVT